MRRDRRLGRFWSPSDVSNLLASNSGLHRQHIWSDAVWYANFTDHRTSTFVCRSKPYISDQSIDNFIERTFLSGSGHAGVDLANRKLAGADMFKLEVVGLLRRTYCCRFGASSPSIVYHLCNLSYRWPEGGYYALVRARRDLRGKLIDGDTRWREHGEVP